MTRFAVVALFLLNVGIMSACGPPGTPNSKLTDAEYVKKYGAELIDCYEFAYRRHGYTLYRCTIPGDPQLDCILGYDHGTSCRVIEGGE